jgi:hypothetical protein
MKREREEFHNSSKKIKIHPLVGVIYDILDPANQDIILKDYSNETSILRGSIKRFNLTIKKNPNIIPENLTDRLNILFNLKTVQDVVLSYTDKVILKSLSYRLDSSLISYLDLVYKDKEYSNLGLTLKQDVALLGKSKDDTWLERLKDNKAEKSITELLVSMGI